MMLAQNFKTADDLGLTDQHLDALIKTLALMDSGKLTHVINYDYVWANGRTEFTAHFNMADWSAPSECGTVCCIGGTAEYVGNISFGEIKNTNQKLHDLFYPYVVEAGWDKITIAQAAIALRSYLTTGDARWDLAVA
jgi:hypothetical protein